VSAAALASLAAAIALAAGEGDGAPQASPPDRPAKVAPEGSDTANAARAKAGLLPRKHPARAPDVRLPAAPDARLPAGDAAPVVVPAAAPAPPAAPARPGWLRVIVDAARALAGPDPTPRGPPSAAIEDVRARAMGLRVEGRLTVRVGDVTLGAASTVGESEAATPAPASRWTPAAGAAPQAGPAPAAGAPAESSVR